MRIQQTLGLLIVATLLPACAKGPEEQPATATAPTATHLDIAPQTYTRMRFVSELERPNTGVALKTHSQVPRSDKSFHRASATSPIASLAAHELSVTTTAASAHDQQPAMVASMPVARVEPATVSPADYYVDHSAEGDGLLAPSTRVVIRGGMVGGEHKCDPRSEAQARGQLAGRPNSSMPLMPRSGALGGGRR